MPSSKAQLLSVDAVLVWLNPIEGGRDRTILDAMLRDVASRGVLVSAHPVIDRMGTKEVLHRTRSMGWGCDRRLYATADAMRIGLRDTLASGEARVLKQLRGQSGDGVWKVPLGESAQETRGAVSTTSPVRVRHAKRRSVEGGTCGTHIRAHPCNDGREHSFENARVSRDFC
jgi:hypothetical protein